MENRKKLWKPAIKFGFIALIALLLLVPLVLIGMLISDRTDAQAEVESEIASSYAGNQLIKGPVLRFTMPDDKDMVAECSSVDYRVNVTTDELHRAVYKVIVYDSRIDIRGRMLIPEPLPKYRSCKFMIGISDFKGLSDVHILKLGGKEYELVRKGKALVADLGVPDEIKGGDSVDFSVSLDLKGTESLALRPSAKETTVEMSSPFPNPSFQGDYLPCRREVRSDGFKANWKVLDVNVTDSSDVIAVKFVDPANPYQQTMRSLKYGIIIIILVFVAGLLVEFVSKKEISLVQYAVIGLSLVLFYSLLLSFSELMLFGWAYLIAALMTVTALSLYFRAIFKSRRAYLLGLFLAAVYGVNYLLLTMETFALLAGSLVLFALLCVVMYLTVKMNGRRNPETEGDLQ